MTWGKVDPEQLPDAVTCYVDSTIALPLLTAYALARRPRRQPKRLMDRLAEVTAAMEATYLERRGAVRPE
jgi:deoxyhypusine synthase